MSIDNNLQVVLRENNIISNEEIVKLSGDLYVAENVLSNKKRILDISLVKKYINNNISESKNGRKLLKG